MDDPTPTVDPASKPPQRFRRTRIAASMFFGVLTVALVLLWVRSYNYLDQLHTPLGMPQRELTSNYGWLMFVNRSGGMHPVYDGRYLRGPTVPLRFSDAQSLTGISWHFGMVTTQFNLRYRNLFVLLVVLAVAPWSPWHFSLRAMLIATALVAVVLGLKDYAFRQ